jgi:hypothetical protein
MGVTMPSDREFFIDKLGCVHTRENFNKLHRKLSPHWKRVLGPGRVVDAYAALDRLIYDTHVDIRSRSLDRWADDGGAL